jgi:hypothetical protein
MRGRISHKSVGAKRHMRLNTLSRMGPCKIEKGSPRRAQIPASEDSDLASEKKAQDAVGKLAALH